VNNFQFEYPFVLVFFLLYLVITFAFKRKEQTYFIPNFVGVLPSIKRKKDVRRSLKIFIILLSIIDLASPIQKYKTIDTTLHTLDIILSLDTSGSMSLVGLNPLDYNQTRLDVVKNVVKDFLKTRQKDRIGLVVFGNRSAVVSPLSFHSKSLLNSLNKITTGIVGKSTALIDSLVQASKLLKHSSSSSKIIILLSDGDDTASKVPLAVALNIAQKQNIKIYTIAIGESNNNLLKIISQESGAKSFVASNTQNLKEIYNTITALEATTHNQKKITNLRYLYHYPLILSLFLLLVLMFLQTKTQHIGIFSKKILKEITLYPELTKYLAEKKLLFIVLILFLLALWQPLFYVKRNSKQNDVFPLVIALDISSSMAKQDFYPNRLTFGIKKIQTFLQASQNLRTSLLLFSRDAFIASPLSEDIGSLEFVLSNLSLSFKNGSNLFSALEGAEYILHDYKAKNILVISDGTSSQNFLQEAKYLQEKGIKLFVLYLRKNISQSTALKELAIYSDGTFVEAGYSNADMKILFQKISQNSQKQEIPYNNKSKKESVQLFYYPLFIAIFLLFFTFTREYEFKRTNFSLLFISLLLLKGVQIPLNAGLLDFRNIKSAKEYYNKGEYQKSIQIYSSLEQTNGIKYNLANALYKAQMYKKAIKTYKNIMPEKAKQQAIVYYNIANAYLHLHKYKLAKRNYILSLKLDNDTMAQDNLNALLLYLQKKQHPKKFIKDKYKLPQKISAYAKEPQSKISSHYKIQLTELVPNELQKWKEEIKEEKPLIFLQKIKTNRSSQYANKND